MLYAVIIAGGSGTRLWPLSRKSQPKQALKLIGDRTMFQHAVDRLSPLFPPDCIFVGTNADSATLLQPQATDIPIENFIVEPSGRDSGPAAGLAAAHLIHRDADAIMVMLTADHFIVDVEQFRSVLAAAASVANDGTIVTLGIKPAGPDTRFGYIELGPAQQIVDGFRVYESAGFREKPDLKTAQAFVDGGRHVWNSGMFVWRADRLLAEFERQMPESHAALKKIESALGSSQAQAVLEAEWPKVRKISVDYGIMENADRVSVIPVDIGWSDIGSWGALLDVLPRDDNENVADGLLLARDARGCYVRSERTVAVIGMEDVVIVDTPDVLLVCPRSRAEEVRELVKQLEAAGQNLYL
jgi:mannose-1-phosphate guanylyltransferase